jgi:hypothetical protein
MTGGPRPSLAVAPWETTVVLREVLPPRLPTLSLFLPDGRGGSKGGDSGADNVLLE